MLAIAGAIIPATTMATIPKILTEQNIKLQEKYKTYNEIQMEMKSDVETQIEIDSELNNNIKIRSGTAFGITEIILQFSHIFGNLLFGYLYNDNVSKGYTISLLLMLIVVTIASIGTAILCIKRLI